MATKTVVEMLEKNLASLLELAKKWLVTWNIPLGKILHILHHLKKSELQGLIEGNYELVKKQNLKKDDVITLPAFSGPVSLLFSTSKTRKDMQWHSDYFKNLIAEVPRIELPKMKVRTFTLTERLNDAEISNELGGNDKLCFKSKAEALRALGSKTTDAYRDGEETIVYYLDKAGELRFAYCRWSSGDVKWFCDAYRSFGNRWYVGNRILYPAA